MKKNIVALFCFLSLSSYSQNTQKVKDAKEVVWFGLDFTKVNFRGSDRYFRNPVKIREVFFEEWNMLFLKEKEKYDLAYSFDKSRFIDNISQSIEKNKYTDVKRAIGIDEYSIPSDSIKSIIKDYTTNANAEVGLIFIVECLDQIYGEVKINVTFFDIKTKEILISKSLIGDAGGRGFKNYWAGGIYRVMRQSSKYYNSWLKGK